MNRSWISAPKSSESYRKGVEEFLNSVSKNALVNGKMNCPCSRCKNHTRVKRGTVRKHLLIHGFNNSDYKRWLCHDEIDLTSGCSTSTEKYDGEIDRGNASKSTEEDLDGLLKHAMEEIHDIKVKDQGPDQRKVFYLKEVLAFRPNSKKTELVAGMLHPGHDDWMIMTFAFSLNKWRRKFEWDREPFDELMNYLVNVFPLFHKLPRCVNVAWNVFRYNDLKLSTAESDNSSSVKGPNKGFEWFVFKCYACGQDLKPDAGTSTSSKRRNAKKKKKNRRKNEA